MNSTEARQRLWSHAVKIDMTQRYFSRKLPPMTRVQVYLARTLDNRDMNWGRMVRKGARVWLAVGPTGIGRLLTADNMGTGLLEPAEEGKDFSFDPMILPATETFACEECGKEHALLLDDQKTAEQLLYTDASCDAFYLGGSGKKSRGLASLGWIREKAKFFTWTPFGDQIYILACAECAPKIKASKEAVKLENARIRKEKAEAILNRV